MKTTFGKDTRSEFSKKIQDLTALQVAKRIANEIAWSIDRRTIKRLAKRYDEKYIKDSLEGIKEAFDIDKYEAIIKPIIGVQSGSSVIKSEGIIPERIRECNPEEILYHEEEIKENSRSRCI
jgi:hypothetical protein